MYIINTLLNISIYLQCLIFLFISLYKNSKLVCFYLCIIYYLRLSILGHISSILLIATAAAFFSSIVFLWI